MMAPMDRRDPTAPAPAALAAVPAAPVTAPAPSRLGPRTFTWGERTYLMGILNVTPDSFSGDGLAGRPDPVAAAVARGTAVVADGADLLDVGGESTRPGHAPVPEGEELARVVPVVAALRAALPDTPISVDTTKPAVAAAALDAGADLVNDVLGTLATGLVTLAGTRRVPIVLMHNRREPRYRDVVGEVVADLARALEAALVAGVPEDGIVVDPGIGFGKSPEHNLALLRDLGALRTLGRPVLLGASRKSTLGLLLDLPPGERLEATLATTALGIAGGADIVRVHDVRENMRTARVADAVVRGWRPDGWPPGGRG